MTVSDPRGFYNIFPPRGGKYKGGYTYDEFPLAIHHPIFYI